MKTCYISEQNTTNEIDQTVKNRRLISKTKYTYFNLSGGTINKI